MLYLKFQQRGYGKKNFKVMLSIILCCIVSSVSLILSSKKLKI
jgi:hypothetical protein